MRTPIVLTLIASASTAHAATKLPQAPLLDPASMVEIPAGAFMMGQPPAAHAAYGQAWFADQQPAHEVTLDAFSIDRREVTVSEYARFLSFAGGEAHFHDDQPIERVAEGWLPVAGTEEEPMRHVTWADAAAYCGWAGKRLPTEAEWERAAAGAEGREYPWGNDGPSCERAAYFTAYTFCDPGSREAGATPDGILDLAGGVAEWTADFYGPYAAEAASDPRGPAEGKLRVVRGGSLVENALWLRTRARWGADPARHSATIGIRCAWDPDVHDEAIRGDLPPVADLGRVPSDRPLAPKVAGPELVADGLRNPGRILRLGEAWYVLERGASRILRVDAGGVTPAAEELGTPVDMATDGAALFVTDTASASVLRVDPATGSSEALATDQPDLGAIVADEAGPIWRSGDELRTTGGLLAEVKGLRSFVPAGDDVIFATDGGGYAAATYVGKVPRAGGEITRILEEPFNSLMMPSQVAVKDGTAYVVIAYRSFPDNSWLCPIELATGAGSCVAGGAPITGIPLAIAGNRVLAAGRSTLYGIDLDGPARLFRTLALWTQIGGIASDGSAVIWTDAAAGRIHRLHLE